MWFYIPAIIVIALLAFWITRTNLFRNRLRSAPDPVNNGTSPAARMVSSGSTTVVVAAAGGN